MIWKRRTERLPAREELDRVAAGILTPEGLQVYTKHQSEKANVVGET